MKKQISNFRDDGRKKFTIWQIVNLEMKKVEPVKASPPSQSRQASAAASTHAANCSVLSIKQLVHFLRNTHNRNTAIYPQT